MLYFAFTLGHIILFTTLTLLTQLGGISYLAALWVSWRLNAVLSSGIQRPLIVMGVFVAAYSAISFGITPLLAARFDQVRVPCFEEKNSVLRSHWLPCLLNRNYLEKNNLAILENLGKEMASYRPAGLVTILEAGFPFRGFPMFPHLSHRDGRSVDLAFFYRNPETGAPYRFGSPSFIGYFVYQPPRENDPQPCKNMFSRWRWNFGFLQPDPLLWIFDPERTGYMVRWLTGQSAVRRIFIEPHLVHRMGIKNEKIRFQGCQAARHDDHLHIDFY